MTDSLLTGVTSTGTVADSEIYTSSHTHVSWVVDFSNAGGSCTALVVDLECSIDDGTTWVVADTITFSSAELTAKAAGSFWRLGVLECVRANVKTPFFIKSHFV